MVGHVDFDALENAANRFSSNITTNTNLILLIPNALESLWEYLSKNNNKHDNCFSDNLEQIVELETEATSANKDCINLQNMITYVIQIFREADGKLSDSELQLLQERIKNCFNTSILGIIPFNYNEIDEFNKLHGSDFRIQGFTTAGNYYLFTAHDKSNKYNSRVYIYDCLGNYVSYIEIPTKADKRAHVGGVTYDSKHDILFITERDGKVCGYDFSKYIRILENAKKEGIAANIDNDKGLKAIKKYTIDISNHIKGKTSAATTYYSEDEKALYVADCAGSGTLVKYTADYTKSNAKVFDSGTVVSKDFASCCQGIATYQDKSGKNYIYATQSYGSVLNSVIKKYEVSGTEVKEVGAAVVATPGLEGIKIDKEGNLSGIYENFKSPVQFHETGGLTLGNDNKTLNVNVNQVDFSKKLSESRPGLELYYNIQGTKNRNNLQ